MEESKETIEVHDVGTHVFKTGKEAARLLAFMEGLQLADADYWIMQPVAAFHGLGEAIKMKIKTMENEVVALSSQVQSLKKDLDLALQPPPKADDADKS